MTEKTKTKHRDKSDLGPDFVAPDGGWGWVVCLAAGFANLAVLPALQQYGLIYRQRMKTLGFDAKQTTTIINYAMALSSFSGIVNGAIFRRYTFRQVTIVGGLLVFLGVFGTAFCTTFPQYIICLSIIYGLGQGISMAATALAVNTYFKVLRRRATGFTWTITGLGPIIFSHLTTFLLVYYGLQGTILIFAAIGLNTVACGCTFQPVLWHVKPKEAVKAENATVGSEEALNEEKVQEEYECKYCQHKRERRRSIFSSQHIFNADDENTPGYEMMGPITPMLAGANDGWYGSKLSLASEHGTRQVSMKNHDGNNQEDVSPLSKPNYFNREYQELENNHCTCEEEKALLNQMTTEQLKARETEMIAAEKADEIIKRKMSFKQKVVRFFDLDLLKDFTFVNLAMGMTVMMFGEVNFAVLTPFILGSYGYDNTQISMAMSLQAMMDVLLCFTGPFVLEKVKLSNQVLFAIGIVTIVIGRFLVTIIESYYMLLCVFVLIGSGKSFRSIFAPLVIPSYVPLNRLPAASGLQLLCNTIVAFAVGPLLGIITDATNYSVTIHCLNILSLLALLMWYLETLVRRCLGKPAIKMND